MSSRTFQMVLFIQRAARIAFFAAAVLALVMAVLPHPPRIPGDPPDKIQHMLAFATLGTLAAVAYPNRSIRFLLAALAVFGGAIEVAQAIPMLNRDSELADWLADVAAALVALALTRWWLSWRLNRKTWRIEP